MITFSISNKINKIEGYRYILSTEEDLFSHTEKDNILHHWIHISHYGHRLNSTLQRSYSHKPRQKTVKTLHKIR